MARGVRAWSARTPALCLPRLRVERELSARLSAALSHGRGRPPPQPMPSFTCNLIEGKQMEGDRCSVLLVSRGLHSCIVACLHICMPGYLCACSHACVPECLETCMLEYVHGCMRAHA